MADNPAPKKRQIWRDKEGREFKIMKLNPKTMDVRFRDDGEMQRVSRDHLDGATYLKG